ncbi:MAG: GDP-mannose 4,6-dehydratase [Candidatus Micrarchaeota archaeon]|nr:GDP-mannose 4,6-dehydratase [Candidatus Micrarchaeota archaeon]
MADKKKRILITGAAGFIGSHICDGILKSTDWDIVVVDRLDYASNGFNRLRDSKAFDDKRVTIYTWDLCLPISENLAKEIGHIDYVLHMAASTHVDDSIANPVPFIRNNIDNTLTMLEYSRAIKPERFVLFSTDEVYSTAPDGVDYKEGDRFNPGNPYSASKAAAECICMAYANTYKVPITILNTMNVLGERQHPQKYLPKIINHILDGKMLEIHSNPEKTKAGRRYYIHARNVADAVMFILNNTTETLHPIDASKGKFNIVGEKEMDNLELARLVEKAVKKYAGDQYSLRYELVDYQSQRPGHDFRYSLSGEKLRKLGWVPPKTIEEGVDKIVGWSLNKENIRWLGRTDIKPNGK